MSKLTLKLIRDALEGDAAAFRSITELKPAGGDAQKVFPPTYEGGTYATEGAEHEQIGKDEWEVRKYRRVLLDSVQSQANRLEEVLLRGYRDKKLKFPLITVDFGKAGLPEVGEITALEAPHRIADAILRDSVVERSGKSFRHKDKERSSDEGLRFEEARVSNATPLFELCPTALIFGTWDSTGPKGGLGAKFQRALVSEIVAYDAEPGKRPSSRIDPLGIEKEAATIYSTLDGRWTLDSEKAAREKGKPKLYGKEGKPSEINHGNVTPSLRNNTTKQLNPGGFVIARAVQTTVLSLPALRRLRFPLTTGKNGADLVAQATLVALALCAMTGQYRTGYDLRSRCLLDGPPGKIELLRHGKADPYDLDFDGAAELLAEAAKEAVAAGLP
jgi:CRISPR-associated protein Csb1